MCQDSLVDLSIVGLVFGANLLELLINNFPVFGIFSGALCIYISLRAEHEALTRKATRPHISTVRDRLILSRMSSHNVMMSFASICLRDQQCRLIP
jgi:hypothetical protein